MNIAQLILGLLTKGDTLSKLAPVLGISEEQAGKTVHAAVPGLLAGITGAATEPGGAATLSKTLEREEHGFLDNFPSFPSGQTGSIASRGNEALSTILGGSTLNQISSVISRYTGIGEGIISRALGMIAPVILGVIRKNSRGLDPTGIANLLSGQKENIAAAMPSGLGAMLSAAVPSIGKFLGSTAEPHEEYASAPRSGYEERTPVGSGVGDHGKSHSAWKWILPVALAALILYFLPRSVMFHRSRPQPVGEQRSGEVARNYGVETSKLASEGSTLIQSATETVGSISDEASAASAVPRLRSISSKLEGLRHAINQLPEPAQKAIADRLKEPVGKLQTAAKPVLSIPEARPAINEIFGELNQIVGENEKVIAPLR